MPSQCIVFFICFCLSLSRVLSGNMTMEACEPKKCGDFNISYPFWISGEQPSYCGYPPLEIDCNDGKPFFAKSYNSYYYIKDIFYENNTAVLVNSKLTSDAHDCPILNRNISLRLSQFVISPSPVNAELIFLYNCSKRLLPPNYLSIAACTNQSYLSNETFVRLYTNYPNENQQYPNDLPSECSSSKVPVLGSNNPTVEDYKNLMVGGFWVSWMVGDCPRCKESNGQCGFNSSIADFMCICSNGNSSTGITNPVSCPITGKGSHSKNKFIIGAGALASTIACFILIIKFQRLRNFLWKYNTQQNIETILEKYGSLAPKKYKYAEIKKITNSFRDKLGRGGFGTVYRGTEQDGRLVAVKILHNSTSNGEEFINEVISISRTSHVHVVNLLGFCIKGSKQALVYEYMPNGSLDKYIYCEDPKTSLGWEKLFKIAIGIARGLEYLHSGCSTHIVHFDIKPQNILLDEDFCPKIADFGLAKLCPPKESILSMVDMRGTIGFIAPEVFSRSMGVVSTKSDVYSFGMLVLEMVGGRKNAKMSVLNSSQVYFPHWIYDHIIENGEIQVCDVTSETEQIARKMALVGIWCTQMAPASRPSMSKASEMLEKDVDELEIPPKPYFSFSPTSNSENTIQNLTSR